MTVFRIPLVNTPQTFEINLSGTNYLMTCKWNDATEAGWALDIADLNTGLPIVFYIPLVTGVNLLEGLEYLGIGGQLYVATDGNQDAVPTLLNLGVESFLYFVTELTNA